MVLGLSNENYAMVVVAVVVVIFIISMAVIFSRNNANDNESYTNGGLLGTMPDQTYGVRSKTIDIAKRYGSG